MPLHVSSSKKSIEYKNLTKYIVETNFDSQGFFTIKTCNFFTRINSNIHGIFSHVKKFIQIVTNKQ